MRLDQNQYQSHFVLAIQKIWTQGPSEKSQALVLQFAPGPHLFFLIK